MNETPEGLRALANSYRRSAQTCRLSPPQTTEAEYEAMAAELEKRADELEGKGK